MIADRDLNGKSASKQQNVYRTRARQHLKYDPDNFVTTLHADIGSRSTNTLVLVTFAQVSFLHASSRDQAEQTMQQFHSLLSFHFSFNGMH
jgi:hypothetical protein